MKCLSRIVIIALTAGLVGFTGARQAKPADQGDLQSVLHKMDEVAATFRSAQANFEWDTY